MPQGLPSRWGVALGHSGTAGAQALVMKRDRHYKSRMFQESNQVTTVILLKCKRQCSQNCKNTSCPYTLEALFFELFCWSVGPCVPRWTKTFAVTSKYGSSASHFLLRTPVVACRVRPGKTIGYQSGLSNQGIAPSCSPKRLESKLPSDQHGVSTSTKALCLANHQG